MQRQAALAKALIGFPLKAKPQDNVSGNGGCVVNPAGMTALEGEDVVCIDQGVDAIDVLALAQSAVKSLGGDAIAAGVGAKGLEGRSGLPDAWHLRKGNGGKILPQLGPSLPFKFLPDGRSVCKYPCLKAHKPQGRVGPKSCKGWFNDKGRKVLHACLQKPSGDCPKAGRAR